MPLASDSAFAGYTILHLLGSGGMGEVYLVRHPRLPRQDALKVLRPDISADPDYRERFHREGDLASKLWHPHIVGIHDRGEYDHRLWFSMDYVDGTDASRMLREQYPAGMPLPVVLEIVTAVASALDYAHARGLLHRDVKPANILVARPHNGEHRILLSDFGVARELGDSSALTVTNMTVGTMAYAAPEQLMGLPLDGRADQYALAATAFHLLNGSPLFPHSNPAVVISQHLNAAPPSLAARHPELAALDGVLARALAKDPGHRFASCVEFARALKNSHFAPPTATAPTPPATAVSATKGLPWGWILVAAAALLAVCVGAYFAVRILHRPAQATAFTLSGTVHLKGDGITTSGLPTGYSCAGGRGFDDLAPGAPVTVADETGKTLAKGAVNGSYGQPGVCNLRFRVDDVPAGASFYRVQVGRQSPTTYIEAEARAGVDISLGTLEGSSTTGSAPTTTTRSSTPPTPDPEQAALSRLQSIAASDRELAAKYLTDEWVPQVSSKYDGLHAEGIVWDYVAILNEHLALRQKWGNDPSVLLLSSPDWSTFDTQHGYWVTVAGLYSPDYRVALGWCRDQHRDSDHCFAKLISTTHPVEGSTEYQ